MFNRLLLVTELLKSLDLNTILSEYKCEFFLPIRESKHKSIVSAFINSLLDTYHVPGSMSTANKETYNLIHNYNTIKEVIAH